MRNADLYDFMKQLQAELASEYSRIQTRVKEDPGIAGGQGEENWAQLMRAWLPSTYQVVTKGRIVDHDGISSPEIDLIVLHPAYPRHLLNKKHYLAGGVVAAFECKLTLQSRHLRDAFETSSIVKNLVPRRLGTPYEELQQPIVYGLLAHAHNWKGKPVDAAFKILEAIDDHQFYGPQHPSEMMDVICVANIATYTLSKNVYLGPKVSKENGLELLKDAKAKDGVATGYVCSWEENDKPYLGTALGNLVCDLITRLAREDASLRPIADYYTRSMGTGGISRPVLWYSDILSKPVLRRLRLSGTDDMEWSEWTMHL